MTSTLGGKALKNIYIGDKQAGIMYKGTDIIYSAKFKVGAIIGQAISTPYGEGYYSIDYSKAGWTSAMYKNSIGDTIYTFPNFPIYKLPNGIKLRFHVWNHGGVESNTTSFLASDIAKGVGDYKIQVQMNGKNLEIIMFNTVDRKLYEITAY